jgi:hypothetical protein
MMVITLKHGDAVLTQILILLLKQFSYASVGNKTLITSHSRFFIIHYSNQLKSYI